MRPVGVEYYMCDRVGGKGCNIKHPVLIVHLFRRLCSSLFGFYGIAQSSLQAGLPNLSPHDLWQTAVLPDLLTVSVAITDLPETINDVEERIRIFTIFWMV